MPAQRKEKIEYEFLDLRRNDDPISGLTLAQLGIEPDDVVERQEGKKRKDAASRKDDDADDGRDDRDLEDDDDEDVTLSRKELSRQLTDVRRKAERKASKDLQAARDEVAGEVGKLQKRLDGVERKGATETLDAEYAPKIAELEEKLTAAMEAGESAEVIKLNRQLAELTADHKIAKSDAKRAAERDEPEDLDADAKKRAAAANNKRAQRWLDDQDEDWFNDPDQEHVRAYLIQVDRVLRKKGYDPDEDDYYVQLERKVDSKFPGVITRLADEPKRKKRRGDDDEDDADDADDEGEFDDIKSKRGNGRREREESRDRQREAADRSPVNEGDRGGGNRDRQQRRKRDEDVTTLSRTQVANMRAFNLDPDNTKHVEEYLLEVKRNNRDNRRR